MTRSYIYKGMKIEVGVVLHDAWADDDGKIHIDEHHCRTLRQRPNFPIPYIEAHFTTKNEFTWFKTRGRGTHWKWADNVGKEYKFRLLLDNGGRYQLRQNWRVPASLAKSRRGALHKALRELENNEIEEYLNPVIVRRAKTTLRRMITRLSSD